MSGSPAQLRYLVTFTAAVLLPGAQAAISGFTAFVIAASIAFYLAWDKPWIIAALVGGVAFGLGWLGGVMWWRGRIVGEVKAERAQVYPAVTTRVLIEAQDPSGAYLAGAWLDLGITQERLIQVAKRLESGSGFSYAGLAGKGKPLSRNEFDILRDEFIKRGLGFWVDPLAHAQGSGLTLAGWGFIRRVATMRIEPINSLPQRRRVIPELLPEQAGLQARAGARASIPELERSNNYG